MALSLATFRVQYSEFAAMADATVTAQLALAEARIDRDVLDAQSGQEKGDLAVGLRTAAALRRMLGEHAAGSAKEYEEAAGIVELACAAAYRVT